MFYYYEKDGNVLASDQGDLPWPKAEPAPGAPVFYLVEGDPALGRGSFKVNCPGQLRAPHGLEVLDASRLPDFPLDAPLSAALTEGRLTAVNIGRPGWEAISGWESLPAAPPSGPIPSASPPCGWTTSRTRTPWARCSMSVAQTW